MEVYTRMVIDMDIVKLEKLLEKSKKYKYQKCKDRFDLKHFGICSNMIVNADTFIEIFIRCYKITKR